MIRGVNQVVLYVEDQEVAKRFWVDTLGFTLDQDEPYGEERWLSVVSPDGATKLVLSKRAPGWTMPDVRDGIPHSNVFFYTDDVEKTYQELTAKGVDFPEPPSKQFFGWWSMFSDPDGTRYALGQRWGV
ncbi:glyoxalase superfamily protein [Actinophytocola sp. NPDC049390]|uniref:glyoxalase superfamily protein n=1 Tax=Actinophytocola sp. NPDC049390 TaxID=3363894 RepID=UPI0037B4AF95